LKYEDADKASMTRVLAYLDRHLQDHPAGRQIPVIHDLRVLRNDASHDLTVSVTPLAAHDYAVAALQLALQFKAVADQRARTTANELANETPRDGQEVDSK